MRTDYLTPIEWWLPLEKVGVSLSFRVFDRFLGVVALMFRWCQRPAPIPSEQGGPMLGVLASCSPPRKFPSFAPLVASTPAAAEYRWDEGEERNAETNGSRVSCGRGCGPVTSGSGMVVMSEYFGTPKANR